MSDGTLNRPFSRFCRRCGRDFWKSDEGLKNWERGRRHGWDRTVGGIGAPAVVQDLTRFAGEGSEPARVGWSMALGVLAIHFAGNATVLLHPFAPPEAEVVWEGPGDGSADEPFNPLTTAGGRDVIFSGPRMVRAVDLWGCQRLGADREASPRTIRCDTGCELVGPPVPLGERRLGMIFRVGSDWRWGLWDLDADPAEDDAQLARRWKGGLSLKIPGEAVDCFRLGPTMLAITSTMGHWVWPVEAAVGGAVGQLRERYRIEEKSKPSERRVLDPGDRWWRPRSILPLVSNGRQVGVEWFFRVSSQDGPGGHVERYRVLFDGTSPESPRPLRDSEGLRPVGVETAEGLERAVFLSEKRELLRLVGPVEQLERTGVAFPSFPRSLQLEERTFWALGSSGGDGTLAWVGTLGPEGAARVETRLAIPYSDPLLWSRWCFTVEQDINSRLMLLRRDLAKGARLNEPETNRWR